MAWARAALLLGAVVAVALVLVSGGSDADPRTPAGLPGLPPPFLGTAVAGNGSVTAAVDAYGDVVDLRAPGPAGRALIDNPSDRQAAGTVPAETGIVPRVSIGGGPALPLWRAESVSQRYLPGTNVVRTVARFEGEAVVVTVAAVGRALAMRVRAPAGGGETKLGIGVNVEGGVRCAREGRAGQLDLLCRVGRAAPPVHAAEVRNECSAALRRAAKRDRSWLGRVRGLGAGAPAWARAMYERSLLTLHALTGRNGAVAAGARDGWAYVWPRDAATAALAFEAAGLEEEARRIVDFLSQLRIDEAARFDGEGGPVAGRGPQGDARGWIEAAAAALRLDPAVRRIDDEHRRPDYQEVGGGTYLGNALSMAGTHIAAGTLPGSGLAASIRREFGTARGLVREAGDPGSGLDSAAAWAVRPFSIPALYPRARRTLLHLLSAGTRFGITPGEGWTGGVDPWTAPTAWAAWALAALADAQRRTPHIARADRRQALRLLGDLRRAATPAGALPERVDVATGLPRSTTPLAWSHAFAILALRELWSQTR